MRYPQLLIVEPDQRLAGMLRDLAKQHQWTLREPRSAEACLRFLRQSGASVVVLKAGIDPNAEMALLERCSVLFPDASTLVAIDSENPPLSGLAWDLGAAVVFGPSQPREHLPALVAGLMEVALDVPEIGHRPARPARKEGIPVAAVPPPASQA
jgi:DNA-binding NtrC family response regulator